MKELLIKLISLVLIFFIIVYSLYLYSKSQTSLIEESKKLLFEREVNNVLNKVLQCLEANETYEGLTVISYSKLKEYKDLEIEPKCAKAFGIDYYVEIEQKNITLSSYSGFGAFCGFAWILDTNGFASRVAASGIELGRHYTAPNGIGTNPSRTAVDKYGNVWIGNRGSNLLIKIGLYENNQCKGHRTSKDLNRNGKIENFEMVDFNEDDCILEKIYLEGGRNVRAVCADLEGNIYAGLWEGKKFYKINGTTGKIIKEWDLPSNPYGCVADKNNKIWISTINNGPILVIENDNIVYPEPSNILTYGIWRCYNEDCVVFTGWDSGNVYKFNTTTKKLIWEKYIGGALRGIVVDKEENIYVVDSNGRIIKLDKNGNIIKTISGICGTPTGASIDACNNIWITCFDGNVILVDEDLRIKNKFKIPGTHYQYSDFTGYLTHADIKIGFPEKKIETEEFKISFGIRNITEIAEKAPRIVKYKTTISIPIVIKYNETVKNFGELRLFAITGELQELKDFIEEFCSKDITSASKRFYLTYDYKIKEGNKICLDEYCWFIDCSYEVEEKDIKMGEKVIKLVKKGDEIEISE